MAKQTPLQELQLSSYLSGANAPYIETLYDMYLANPQSVTVDWQQYFASLKDGQLPVASPAAEVSLHSMQKEFVALAKLPRFATPTAASPLSAKQEAVDGLINAYRNFGHLHAHLDPLGTTPSFDDRLTLDYYQLNDQDLAATFITRGILPQAQATLREIYQALQLIYSGTMSVEYSAVVAQEEREWVRNYVESQLPAVTFAAQLKRTILQKLIAADGLEKYLDTKYKAQKRFSGEGADSLIPMLDMLIKHAGTVQLKEVVICMAHRARLSVLVNVMGQSPLELFQEFEGTKDYGLTTGDVKYHLGFSSDVETAEGPIHLSLAFNPSHLEFVNPVIMGSVRARQDRELVSNKKDYALAVMIHGDAAFSGQGIVMETLSMSQTRGYTIGGTIHIIINNQVGFTTSDPDDLRSSIYCSDIAKSIDAPIIHVNGDDPEAVVKAVIFALDYRMQFHKDVFIDLVCYRRHGHQEVDEPRATQPLMYKIISTLPTPRELYAQKLIAAGVCTEQEVNLWLDEYRDNLDQGVNVVQTLGDGLTNRNVINWAPFLGQSWITKVDTSEPQEKLIALGKKLTELPVGFQLQRNVQMVYDARKKMTAGEMPLDWGYAELLAYASLLVAGHSVRLTGEDVRRGTFFHRHAVVIDQNTGEPFMPLSHLSEHQAPAWIYDSLLSEAGVVGFEYGYAASAPNSLVMWEAQYGDFANGAQVIIDQFISSGWQKWQRLSGVAMLLPHGHQGDGPEHTSARLERYLQLAAQENMQIFVPTTPAQIFHLLRRQVLRPLRVPLIVMSPKNLLRHKLAVSSFDDLSHGQLQLVIPEIDKLDVPATKRVILCSGKVYYELLAKRRELELSDIAIIRIEQLYPFPFEELNAALSTYPNLEEVVWCQEEPKNQGAWFCTRHRLEKCLRAGQQLRYVGRVAMAAPSVGYSALHQKEQIALVNSALAK